MTRNRQVVDHFCDGCGAQLAESGHLVIVTSKDESEIGWRRLHVTVLLHHGSHNDGSKAQADLCQTCAVSLLQDALSRVRVGERVSAGVQTPEAKGFGILLQETDVRKQNQ